MSAECHAPLRPKMEKYPKVVKLLLLPGNVADVATLDRWPN